MSNPESMQQLAERFMNDAQFREEMKQDPEGAAERSGYHLDDEDKQALRGMDWRGTDEALNDRVSKISSRARRAACRCRRPAPGAVSRTLLPPFATGTIKHRRYKKPPSALLTRRADRRARTLAFEGRPVANI